MSFAVGIIGGVLTLCLYYVGLFVLGELSICTHTITVYYANLFFYHYDAQISCLQITYTHSEGCVVMSP